MWTPTAYAAAGRAATRSRPGPRWSALLRERGDLIGEPRPITHPVKFYERGDLPLEIVSSRQWYLRNGGRDAELREELLAARPAAALGAGHMRHRYEHWVGGLTGDWLISRQRFFGVPFPVWYRLDDARRARLRPPAHPGRGPPAGRPVLGRARRVRRDPARPAGRVHRRPRRDGHLGDVVAHAADRRRLGDRPGPVRPGVPDGPATAVARDHPDLAVRRGGAGPGRARRAALADGRHLRLDPRPRPQEDVQVQGQRRGHARPRCWSSSAPTRCGTGPPAGGPASTSRSTPGR